MLQLREILSSNEQLDSYTSWDCYKIEFLKVHNRFDTLNWHQNLHYWTVQQSNRYFSYISTYQKCVYILKSTQLLDKYFKCSSLNIMAFILTSNPTWNPIPHKEQCLYKCIFYLIWWNQFSSTIKREGRRKRSQDHRKSTKFTKYNHHQ